MIQPMLARSHLAERAQAQAYMDRFGRNMFAVGLNRASYGMGVPGQGLQRRPDECVEANLHERRRA
jgi:hypothetical protein